MRLLIATEARLLYCPHSTGYFSQSTFGYDFWSRYLSVFSRVTICARVRKISTSKDLHRVDGPNVDVTPLRDYQGLLGFISALPSIRPCIRHAMARSDAILLRVPGAIGGMVAAACRTDERPYALEVVGDPYDVFSPGAFSHPFRCVIRWLATRSLMHQCRDASAVSYVTGASLQRRYPPGSSSISCHYSSIELPTTALTPRVIPNDSTNRVILASVGTMSQNYKGFDTLIDAVHSCVNDTGLNLGLRLLGDGAFRAPLRAQAEGLGLDDRIVFCGLVQPTEAVFHELDRAHLFVLASRTEGLPRAMIEAMARGVPCIGTTVGGIPELLDPEDMVPPNDPVALANKIREVLGNPVRMAAMSARNLSRAREYTSAVLVPRRVAFYQAVKERTERWLRERTA